MALSKRLRFEILRRDNHACRYCGACAPDAAMTVDHVVPTVLGGRDDPTNLVAACKDCNAGKSASNPDAPVVADVKADALRWTRAMQRAAQIRLLELDALAEYTAAVDGIWESTRNSSPYGGWVERPDDWAASVSQFFAHGLDLREWEYAIGLSIHNRRITPYKKWTYMCGIMWTRLREQMDIAEQLAEQPDGEAT